MCPDNMWVVTEVTRGQIRVTSPPENLEETHVDMSRTYKTPQSNQGPLSGKAATVPPYRPGWMDSETFLNTFLFRPHTHTLLVSFQILIQIFGALNK